MKSIDINWAELDLEEKIDFTCPFCNGEGCEECSDGYIEPVMNYAYPIDCNCTIEYKRIAARHGLFLFKHPDNGEVHMSLTGSGMDLSPNILIAYLRLTGSIPIDLSMEFWQNYWLGSKESHREAAKACVDTIKDYIKTYQEKLKTIQLFLDKPDACQKPIDTILVLQNTGIDREYVILTWNNISDISIVSNEDGTPKVFKSRKDAKRYGEELNFTWKIIKVL